MNAIRNFIISAAVLLAAPVAFGVGPAAPIRVIFGPITNEYNNHVYYLLDDSGWAAAEQTAVMLGGHLATVRDSIEQAWISSNFTSYGGENRCLWIGFHDPDPINNASDPFDRRSEFVWSSGEPVNYVHWAGGEPSNYLNGEYVTHIWPRSHSATGEWNDNADYPAAGNTLRWNGVVEKINPLVIECPPTLLACPSETDPRLTGEPSIISSCGPRNLLQISYRDHEGFESIERVWTVTDPTCNATETCTQRINLIREDNPRISVETLYGGLIQIFRASGTRGSIQSAEWTVDGFRLRSGPGVTFLNGSRSAVEIDFTRFELNPGSVFDIQVTVQTSCTAGGGATGEGTSPPIYTLARGQFGIAYSSDVPPARTEVSITCSDGPTMFRTSSRWFRFKSSEAGLAAIRCTGPSTRLTALDPNSDPRNPSATACGTQKLFFSAESGATYVVIADGPDTFSIESQIEDPVKTIAHSGNLVFGSVAVGQSTNLSLVITNTGNSTVTISGLDLPQDFTADWTSGEIAAGSARLVNLTFTPRSARDYLEIATIVSEAAGNKIFALSGRGYVPRLIDVSGNLSFGTVAVGASSTATLRITNPGSSTLTISRLLYPASFYGEWDGGEIAPGTERDVVVRFAPSEPKAYSGQIEVISNATSGTGTIGVTGVGVTLLFKEARLPQTGTGQIVMKLEQPASRTIIIETSDDLKVWGGARVLRGLGPVVDWTEEISSTNRARFFRLLLP